MAVLAAPGGCKVGPDFVKPAAPVPKSWSEATSPRLSAEAPVDLSWWRAFQDPTLDDLVERAYRQNLPLQIAGLRIVEARARLAVAAGEQYPQLQAAFAEVTAVGLSGNAPILANVGGLDRHLLAYQLGFDAFWELDFWGKYRRGVEAQTASMMASVADYHAALVSLTAEVARTYVVVRTYEVLVDLARENAALQHEGLRIAESRFRNGATSELDVTQARTLWEATRASIPLLQISLQQARNALSTLLALPPDAATDMLAGPRRIPTAPARVAVAVPADLLRRRPDIRGAEMRAAAQSALIGVAKSDLYPSFTLFGSVGLEAFVGGGGSSNLFSGDSLFYRFGPRIFWPFFNYGRLRNAVRVEDAQLQQLLVEYRNTVLDAVQEVEDALVAFLKSEEALQPEESSVRAARRSVEISMVQYREGAVDYQRVLDAQRALLQQQNSLAQTRSSSATSLIALYKALGGGWELRAGQSVVPERMQHEMKARTDWDDMLSPPSGENPAPAAP